MKQYLVPFYALRIVFFIWLIAILLMMPITSPSFVGAQEPTPTHQVSTRIVGGAPADPGEWPWQVALIGGSASEFYFSQFCGGSLISAFWVLTAAHCVTYSNGAPMPASSVDVVAGIYNLSSPASGYQRRDVSQIIVHPNFNPNTLNNDIALLRLASPVTLGGSGETAVAAIPLISSSLGDLAGMNAWATGWGYTESTPAYPSQLYEVQLPIVSNQVCNQSHGGGITSGMICAGFPEGGKDTCAGDSGGPLVVFVDGAWRLAGVTSWGNGCADPGFYGVYTRVSNYASWIASNTTIFSDVPSNHWAREYIEAMYLNGYTAGCGTNPLRFCPETIMNRVESAVFILRGNFGSSYNPPPPPWGTFADNWSAGAWGEKWAEGLYREGLTAGCATGPLRFCPWDLTPRVQLAVFSLRLKHGNSYNPPPATGTVFADLTNVNFYGTKWAEQAYLEGLIPACGTQGGKPMFCPDNLVSRALAAYSIVKAKNLLP